MWDHRAPARPVGCLLAVAGAEVECCPPPEVGGQVWGWRAVVVPRVAAAAAMRHFPSCRVRHRGESWQRGVRPPTAESTHISLTERGSVSSPEAVARHPERGTLQLKSTELQNSAESKQFRDPAAVKLTAPSRGSQSLLVPATPSR